MQGGKLALVDSADFVIIIMGHAKMSCLRHAAANTYVEVNSGGAAVIARAVQAGSIQSVSASDAIQDVVLPPIETVSASETVQDVVVPPIVAVSASDTVQGVVMPPIAVHVMNLSIAVKTRMRKVPASVLKTIPALQTLPDSCLIGLELRQIEEGELDENGQDIGGWFVMVDVAAVLLYKDAGNARKFARNPNFMNKEILTSLTWVDSGNPNVSNILFQYYFLDNFLCTRGIE